VKIGIIGGSGLYDIEELKNREWVKVDTPFGKASDDFLRAELEGVEVIFLPRHGRKHNISPSEINYRANIYGMKSLGVEKIVSVAACGSLKEDIKPLDFLIPDQFIDRTAGRKSTFFEAGIVVHIGFGRPVCDSLSAVLYETASKLDLRVHYRGTYVNIEGPQFSTIAESNLYRSWDADIIGMTNMTEARLAREAEICYGVIAAVTDYDCWRDTGEPVSVEMVMDNFKQNNANSKKIITSVIPKLTKQRLCECKDSLKYSIVTQPESVPKETKDKLGILIDKYIK
jgi:5'-methylthioadenosine phosphorylase